MIIFKFGKGKGKSFSMSFGGVEAELKPMHKKMTLEEIANQLAKQFRIVNGEVTVVHMAFNYAKGDCKDGI